MINSELPFRATTSQACHWLALQTGTAWSLARLIGSGLRPSVWLDYGDEHAVPFGASNGGYGTPLLLEGDAGVCRPAAKTCRSRSRRAATRS